jgi:hypothetical protein
VCHRRSLVGQVCRQGTVVPVTGSGTLPNASITGLANTSAARPGRALAIVVAVLLVAVIAGRSRRRRAG